MWGDVGKQDEIGSIVAAPSRLQSTPRRRVKAGPLQLGAGFGALSSPSRLEWLSISMSFDIARGNENRWYTSASTCEDKASENYNKVAAIPIGADHLCLPRYNGPPPRKAQHTRLLLIIHGEMKQLLLLPRLRLLPSRSLHPSSLGPSSAHLIQIQRVISLDAQIVPTKVARQRFLPTSSSTTSRAGKVGEGRRLQSRRSSGGR